MQSAPSLLWHDYETFGTNPRADAACQFAAIRTDLDLNIIGKPIDIFCQIPSDYLPQPEAVLVTGITPQQTIRDGYIEAEFAHKISGYMSEANTTVVGYNSIRFDDEVTRTLFYRNFIDPYAREWQHGNARWDIIDLVRACYALRPEGIEWPKNDDGAPIFKLDQLTLANGISHQNAHDAVADVKATIEMAKLIKQRQPALFDYYYALRKKQAVFDIVDLQSRKPFVHVSGMISSAQGCISWLYPLCQHPTNNNAVICIDLNQDIDNLFAHDSQTLKQLLYAPSSELAATESRPAIKVVHCNKSPFVAPAKALSPELADKHGVDRALCRHNLDRLMHNNALSEKISDIFSEDRSEAPILDVDQAIYARGFPSQADKEWLSEVRNAKPQNLAIWQEKAPNKLYLEQLFRYRARNYPDTLTQQEIDKWQQHRRGRFVDGVNSNYLTVEKYLQGVHDLSELYENNPEKLTLLKQLVAFASQI